MIRILIADDHPVVRAGLRAVFSAHDGFEVVAEVDRAAQALVAVRDSRVDVVTMDLRFPDGLSGVDATKSATRAAIPARGARAHKLRRRCRYFGRRRSGS